MLGGLLTVLRQVLLIAGALLFALGAGLFLYLFERADVEVETEPVGEARYNPYLAAALTLDALGMPTARSRVMEVPAEPSGVLLLLAPSRLLEGAERERLLDWVAEGGRLVVLATGEDLLLEPLGIRATWWDEADGEVDGEVDTELVEGDTGASDSGGADDVEIDAEIDADLDTGAIADAIASLFGDGEAPIISGTTPSGEPIEVAWRGMRRLRLDMEPYWALDELAARVVYGEGTVTALSEAGFLENEALVEHDHAALLWALVDGDAAASPTSATLVYWTQPPSLWRWLKTAALPALISGGALLVVWLWGATRRFGPILPDPAPGRRSLLEHLDAAGNYAWKRGDRRALLMGVRDAVAARPGVSGEAIEESLAGDESWQDTRGFTRAVAGLMRIWRER